MDFSKVKLVVSDMDGTLLNSNHKLSNRFFSLFEKMRAHGIIFVAASGRPFYSIVDKFNTIKDEIIIVAENGGLVIKDDEILLSTPLEKENLFKITSVLPSLSNAHPVFCSKNKAFVMSKSEKFLNLLSEYYTNYELILSPESITEEIYKVALYHEKSSETCIYPHVKHLEADFKVKLSATHWVDISENDGNKGNAVNYIQDIYNISETETLVFGDYNNDLEMLDKAYFSYAMANAHPDVKAAAKFSTKSNNDFGVELILEALVSAKETLSS